MPWYLCSQCGTLEKTGETYFWVDAGYNNPPLCSACDPRMGQWHGKFPQQQTAAGLLYDAEGLLWYPQELLLAARHCEIVGIVQEDETATLPVEGQQGAPPKKEKKQPKRTTRPRKVKP